MKLHTPNMPSLDCIEIARFPETANALAGGLSRRSRSPAYIFAAHHSGVSSLCRTLVSAGFNHRVIELESADLLSWSMRHDFAARRTGFEVVICQYESFSHVRVLSQNLISIKGSEAADSAVRCLVLCCDQEALERNMMRQGYGKDDAYLAETASLTCFSVAEVLFQSGLQVYDMRITASHRTARMAHSISCWLDGEACTEVVDGWPSICAVTAGSGLSFITTSA